MLLRRLSLNFIDYQKRSIKAYYYIYFKNLIFIKSHLNIQTHEKYKTSQFEFN